jgi:hypothetical protein
MKKIRIFLASSNELIALRQQFEIHIYRKCKLWIDQGVFLHLEIWEDLPSRISETRSQDEYNKKIGECDLFVLLAYRKLGMYTAEEFETAFGVFNQKKKPFIFTYFKDNTMNEEPSLLSFKSRLESLGHFYNKYIDFSELWNSFNRELDNLLLTGFEEFIRGKPNQISYHISDSKNVNTGNVNTGGGDFRIGDGN